MKEKNKNNQLQVQKFQKQAVDQKNNKEKEKAIKNYLQ